MNSAGNRSARIRFLAATKDDHGRMTHYPGELITGELLARHHDFLLVRATTGTMLYVDTTRTDLYRIELHDPAEPAAPA
jgi:hypothetical protein